VTTPGGRQPPAREFCRHVGRRARFAFESAAESRHRWPRVADLLPEADRRADWNAVRSKYRQAVAIQVSAPRQELPKELLDALAAALDEVSLSYRNDETVLCQHALAVFADAEGEESLRPGVFLQHYRRHGFDRVAADGRRLPTPYEALVETLRRRRDAYILRAALRETPTTGLLVGSTHYGAYQNVRGRGGDERASDLDCLIVMRDSRCLDQILPALAELPGVAGADLEQLRKRARLFTSRYDDGQTMLSHKITLWSPGAQDPIMDGLAGLGDKYDYELSLHFVTDEVLSYLLVDSVPRIERDAAGGCRTVQIYRNTMPRRIELQRSFDGRAYQMDRTVEPVDLGYVRVSRVYYIDPLGSYYPGFVQSMLVPHPELLWDELDIQPRVERFHRKLAERLRREREDDRHTLRLMSFAHPRREVFAPRVIRQLDGPYSGCP
jgi:hypothetical protein